MKIRECLSFDDVLLEPQFSDIHSRKEVSLASYLEVEKAQWGYLLKLPIISAPMDTVTEQAMAHSMFENGGLGIIHRYMSIEEQVKQIKQLDEYYIQPRKWLVPFKAAAVGITGDFLERIAALYEAGCSVICLDVAHGFHSLMEQAINEIRKQTYGPRIHIMAGNVATYDAALGLAQWGVDSIKVGIGGGSICSTRTMTGHGIPTFQSILDCFPVKDEFDVKLIADGGIKNPGDCAKALAAGADFVMLGSMLAGTDETPGEVIIERGKAIIHELGVHEGPILGKYKTYRGMASEEAQIAWRGSVGSKEGVATKIPCKGPVKSVLDNIRTNLASAFSYSGARNLEEFQLNAKFIRQTAAGQIESTTHILNVGGKIK